MDILNATLKQIEPQDPAARAGAHARLEQLAMHIAEDAVRVLTEAAAFEEASVSKADK
jgi:hypothetical protein